jgi:DNA-binding CsgD family transcriptional regulator/tetratricopeptide (TPR) repeat protein
LGTPTPDVALAPSELLRYPGVRLFVERAWAVRPDFSLAPHNAASVSRICQRLEGLPLALELAAARVRALSAEEILEHLDDTFRLLVGGSRTAPMRQRTLRATLDWSFGLLSATEQVVFSRLAVFVGGWTLQAAEAIGGDGTSVHGTDVLEILTDLVDKSLVVADERDGRTRYRLLEPVRQYALEHLRGTEQWAVTRRQHAEYFRNYAMTRERDASVGGARRFAATDALAGEYPNLQAALQWSIEASEAQLGLEIAWALQFLWKVRGPVSEGLFWIIELLRLPGAEAPTPARAVALLTGAQLASLRGDRATASHLYEQVLPLVRRLNDPWISFVAFADMGMDAQRRGDFDAALAFWKEGLPITQANGDRTSEAILTNNLGRLKIYLGRYAEGYAQVEHALHLAREVEDQWVVTVAQTALAWAAVALDDLARARELAGAVLGHCEDRITENSMRNVVALCDIAAGRYPEALAGILAGLEYGREMGSTTGTWIAGTYSTVLVDLASLAAHAGAAELAVRLASAAARAELTLSARMYPIRHHLRDRWLLPIRQQLGEAAFGRCWEAGQHLTAEDALALGIAELGQVRRPEPAPCAHRPPAGPLTSRQQEVAILVAQGLTNRQVAERLVVTERAVAAHVEHILDRLGVASRTQIAVWVTEHGLLPATRT